MEINKRCITTFSKTGPFVALATKSQLFDPTFSLTSELILVNYMTGQVYPAITTDLKFCKILWCEFPNKNYLVAGHENGFISIYERTKEGLVLVKTKECLEDDISAMDFLVSKAVLVAASSKGKVIFWTLSNLDKEFSLDVQLPPNISAISCNPKVFKILCIGTSDGIIKVVDIKKLLVVLTLKSKEFSEVKKLEWDSENNTNLRVMSEKPYVCVFDLSNDTVSRIGEQKEPLIGFQGNTFVCKNKLEVNGISIEIPESFECSISSRDPVIALSEQKGTIKLISIPVPKKRFPFCRINNFILNGKEQYKITIENEEEETEEEEFYNELIQMVNSDTKIEDSKIAEFLLENSYEKIEEEKEIEVDLEDEFTLEIIKNNFKNLKNSEKTIDFSIMDVFISKDKRKLKEIEDFTVLVVLCKLLNDYGELERVKNPRALAATLLFHKISELSPLKETQEGEIIYAILTKNFSSYIDCRLPTAISYLKEMNGYEMLLSKIQSFIVTPLDSKKLVEYFWYQVFLGNFDKVKDLNISDADVKFYCAMQKDSSIVGRIGNMNISKQEMGRNTIPVKTTPQTFSQAVSSQAYQPPASSHAFPQPLQPIQAPTSSHGFSQAPASSHAFPQPMQPMKAPASSQAFPQPMQPMKAPASSQAFPQPSANILKPTTSLPQQFTAPTPFPKSPLQQSVPSSIPRPSFKSAVSSMPTTPALQGIPKSPFSGPIPMNPLRNASFSASKPSIPLTSKPLSPSPVLSTGTACQSKENLSVENPSEVISRFDQLVTEVRQRAALNTSMILKHRKTQFLNALNTYDSLDKSALPSSILYCMDLLSKRMASEGQNMKTDLAVLVEGYSDVMWLKAFVELAKMVY